MQAIKGKSDVETTGKQSAGRGAMVCVVLSLVMVSGCGIQQRLGFVRTAPETVLPFRTDLDKGETPRQFTVKVQAQGADIDAVRESVRHPATGFCVLNFGGSDIAWDTDATGEWRAVQNGDDLTFSGTCTAR